MEEGGEHFRDHKDASAAKHDDHDMRRMGKTPELKRVFRQVSIMSLTCVIMATWEYLFTANSRGLLNGGPAGMIWSYIWTITGFGLMVVSLAELSSMVSGVMICVRHAWILTVNRRHRMSRSHSRMFQY